ncbi:MAE_28990/MAE_18760 family HEPN-like nuclease [Oceanimonas smirnovii]|uniref:MAE_28990/MAE_18760 family HEPN-like nuclease n=1 Tax=Oceanimonas smirnovii TaxID=264574 RepID=UPI003AB0DEE9
MELVRSTFNDRVSDIDSYFDLVKNIEIAVGSGGANINVNGASYRIRPEQQKIMYSGIYLHLYNLIESTVSQLLEAVERHASNNINGDVRLLSEDMRKLYVKSVANPNEASYNKRLENALELVEQVLSVRPLSLKIPLGGGGNWDYKEIKKISKSIGVNIELPHTVKSEMERPIRNDKGPLRLIKEVRNDLAHGSLSFTECGENHVSRDFENLINIVKKYLEHVIDSYEDFIESSGYRQAN